MERFADALAWTQELTVTLSSKTGNTATIQIDTDISIPKAEQMSVIKVKEPEFDAAYKEKLVARIFGNEEVYYNDIPHLPIAALEERYEFYEKNPGSYSYVPAWRLAAVSRLALETPVQIDAAVLINAIDCSEIDLYNEM